VRIREKLDEAREESSYLLVLVLVFATIVFDLAAPESDWASFVGVILGSAMLLMALWVSGVKPFTLEVAALAVGIAIVAALGAIVFGGKHGASAVRLITFATVVLAPTAIVRDVARHPRITIRTVFGVLCIYLLLGLIFASLFAVVADLDSAKFFAQGTDGTPADRLYFSYTTLTTVGFGDFTAATGLGRSLAISEALLGQLYLVVIVALIVGNIGQERHRPPGKDK
jgi:hypothetical protein